MDSFASWEVSARCRRLSWLLHAGIVEAKHAQLVLVFKAGFKPSQPRVPAGNPDGGQWAGSGGGVGGSTHPEGGRSSSTSQERPPSPRARTAVIKQVAKQVAKLALQATAGRARLILDAVEVASWVIEEGAPYIEAYADPPRTLEELQSVVATPARGYDVHHIVEQTPAAQDGFSRSLIDSRENLVRIPTLKHWQITGWYMTPNEDFGGASPRNYLRGKDWTERVRVGHDALIDHGVLKP